MTATTGIGDRMIRRVIAPGSLRASNQECWSLYFVAWLGMKLAPMALKVAVVMLALWIFVVMMAGLD